MTTSSDESTETDIAPQGLAARGMRVKPLEWSDYLPIPPTGEYHARSSVGLYCISHGVGCFALTLRDSAHLGVFPTLEAAKAAAQADYTDRILAALEAAPDLARAERDQARADAQAAVALVVERAADELDGRAARFMDAADFADDAGHDTAADMDRHAAEQLQSATTAIRALSPADGLAAVEALRAEISDMKADVAHATAYHEAMMKAIAERDRLAAANAALEAKLARLVGAATPYVQPVQNADYERQLRQHEALVAALAEVPADGRREGGSPLTDETPAQHEERTCTCGAGHGSLEGHTDWCDFTAYQSLKALAEVQARDDASTPPDDTWHERRTMLPDYWNAQIAEAKARATLAEVQARDEETKL